MPNLNPNHLHDVLGQEAAEELLAPVPVDPSVAPLLGNIGMSGLEAQGLPPESTDPTNPSFTPSFESLSMEVKDWASTRLEAARSGWKKHADALDTQIPMTTAEILNRHPKGEAVIKELFETKQALVASGELTPEGLNFGETMGLAIIPWADMLKNKDDLKLWLKTLRGNQGITKEDFLNENLEKAIQNDTPFYRDPANPSRLISASEYLKQRVVQDGDWGIMLVQTSEDAGLQRIVEGPSNQRSPDAMTDNGQKHFQVANHDVDSLGIFEWLALTAQVDPSSLSPRDYSWLLANRLDVSGKSDVPGGDWCGDHVGSDLVWSGGVGVDGRVRLAVIPKL